MRVDRVQYGPLFLTDVAVVELPKVHDGLFREAGWNSDRGTARLQCPAELPRRPRLCALDGLLRYRPHRIYFLTST